MLFLPFIVIIGGLAAGFAPFYLGALAHQYTEDKLPKSGCWLITLAAFFSSIYLISGLFAH